MRINKETGRRIISIDAHCANLTRMNCLAFFRSSQRLQPQKCMSRSVSTGVDLSFTNLDGDKTKFPIIIAHGMLGSSKNWSSLAKRINKETGRRIISIDARNHGESPHTASISYPEMVQDLVQLYDKLKLSKASIIGHSMGGRTGMGLALLHEELIEKLIVVDVSPTTSSDTVKAISGMNVYFQGLSQVVLPPSNNMAQVRKSVDKQLSSYVPDPGLRAWLAMNLYQKSDGSVDWRINIKGIADAFEQNLAYFPNEWGCLKTNIPTLFIGGEKSQYILKSDHEGIKTQFTSSEICYIPDAGHWVHSEKPNEFLETVLKFM